MDVLFEAMTNLFEATPHNSFYDSIEGKLFLDEAPQETAFPYCVFLATSGISSFMFQPEEYETIPVQFNIHSKDSSAIKVLDIANKLMLLFDDTENMSVTGYNVVWFRRMTPPYSFKVGNKRQVTLIYECFLEKTD